MPRIYLDNAATSWPKPEAVYAAVDRYQRDLGASAGRGAYRSATEAGRMVEAARRSCAALLGVGDATRVVFTPGATAGLNLAIHGLLRRGDHVVSTVCAHNSVLRPLAEAGRRLGVETTYIGCDDQGIVAAAEVAAAMRPNTRLIAVTHASNVTGAIQPVADIAALTANSDAFLLVDAAQTLGHLPVEFRSLGADVLVASGHKGLLGPLGVGVMVIREGVDSELQPMQQGGTGVESQLDRQPDELPMRYEAGSMPAPAIAGLGAAIDFLRDRAIDAVHAHESMLVERLLARLRELPSVRVYGPVGSQQRASVVSFSAEGYDPQELAAALDASAGVEVRAGLHCAPKMHAALGTLDSGGLVRISPGWSTTVDDVDRAAAAIAAIVEST